MKLSHTIPAKHASTSAEATGSVPANAPEQRLQAMLRRAGFSDPVCQKTIDLGRPYGSTTPDFFYAAPNDMIEGVCIYLDGMSAQLHGNPEIAERDRQIRGHLQDMGYEVFTIPFGHLSDRETMSRHFRRLGRLLRGKGFGEALHQAPDAWFGQDE